jgi:hypothetical protein
MTAPRMISRWSEFGNKDDAITMRAFNYRDPSEQLLARGVGRMPTRPGSEADEHRLPRRRIGRDIS